MPKTLVTGGAGFIGSHVAHALAERGDELRLTVPRVDEGREPRGARAREVKRDLLDRRQVAARSRRRSRLPLRRDDVTARRRRRAAFEVNVVARATCSRNACAPGSSASSTRRASRRSGPRARRARGREPALHRGRARDPVRELQARGGGRGAALAAQGLPVVCVNPCVVFGEGDVYGSSTSIVRRFMLGRIPAYVDGAMNIVDVEDVARGHLLADERGSMGERYILGNRNYTLDRLFADLGRVSGVEPPALKLPPRSRCASRRRSRRRRAARRSRSTRSSRPGSGGPTRRRRRSASSAGRLAARGHDRGDGELVHRPRGGPLQALAPFAAGSVQACRRDARVVRRPGARDGPLPLPDADQLPVRLRQGARRLNAKGIDYDQVRVPTASRGAGRLRT